jgi:hypothetical protein
MKTISIIAPDTVPLPIKEDYLKTLSEKEREVFIDRCMYTSLAGIRSWKFAEVLSEKFDVTLLVPDINFPERDDIIDKSKLKFQLDSYNYRVSSWNWTQELDRKLKKPNFVIMQSNSGCGMQNCSVLPGSVNLIVDGWNILPFELSGNLLTHSKISRKVFWNKALSQYKDLLVRANCILIANDRQHCFYEGLFYGIDKLNYSAFQFSPILKVPYGMDNYENIKKIPSEDKCLKILWNGPIYPWEAPEVLIKELANYDQISIDYVNVRNSRQAKAYNTYFKMFFDRIVDISNIQMIDNSSINIQEACNKYDYGINLSRNWLYESYIHKASLIQMLSWKLPVITNINDSLYDEFNFLQESIEPISTVAIKLEMSRLLDIKQRAILSDESYKQLQDVLSWKNVLLPIIDYIDTF